MTAAVPVLAVADEVDEVLRSATVVRNVVGRHVGDVELSGAT